MFGTVVNIETRYVGTQLVGAHTAPVSVLSVLDVSGLPESGQVVVGADTLTYTARTDAGDPGATGTTLILSAATVTTYADGAPVILTPSREHKVALVVIDGENIAIEARVKHSLHNKLPEGPRQTGTGETVHVEPRPGDMIWNVEDIVGKRPTVDAKYTTPSSLPAAAVDQNDWVGNKLIANIITATDMTAATITGATIQTARPEDTGRRTWMDQTGLHQTSAAGVPRMDFPNTQGATNFIKGSLNADSLDVVGPAAFRANAQIAPGAGLTLGLTTPDPTSPPVTLVDWPTLTTDLPRAGIRAGLVYDGGLWWTLVVSAPSTSLYSINPTTGVSTLSFSASVLGYGGVVKVGTSWFVLYVVSGVWRVRQLDAAGTQLADWQFTPSLVGIPALGTDGTNLFVAYITGGVVKVDTLTTAGVFVSRATLFTATGFTTLTAVLYGTFDFAENVWAIATRATTDLRVLVARTGGTDWDAGFSWPLAANDVQSGLYWNGTNFAGISLANLKLYTYTAAAKLDSPPLLTYWVSADWYQVAGLYHSKVSPTAKVTMVKRARLQASMGNIPGSLAALDPDTTRTFIGRGTTDPGPTGAYLNATSASGSGDTVVTLPVFTGTTALTTNTFPTHGAPGGILSADGSLIVDGTYSNVRTLPARVTSLEVGGGPGGRIDIDCGGAAAAGVDIDCGAA